MKKILVVDDEEDIRLLVKTLLEEEKFSVDEANDGKDALDKLGKNTYDLVVLDFFMPGMSGREVLENMRQEARTKKTRVVFLTVATFSFGGQDEIKKLGSMDYIKKPFDNADFIKRVKKALK